VCYICYEVMKCFFFLELGGFLCSGAHFFLFLELRFLCSFVLARFFSSRDRGIGLGEARGDVVPFVF
jgi:hypothetical protein